MLPMTNWIMSPRFWTWLPIITNIPEFRRLLANWSIALTPKHYSPECNLLRSIKCEELFHAPRIPRIAYYTSYNNNCTGKMPVPQKYFFCCGMGILPVPKKIFILCCGMGILPIPKLEQRTSNSSEKIKQKQQCDCHKLKHDFVNDIAPPLPKQLFLNLYLCEPNQTLHRGDSHAPHLAQ